MIETLPRAGPVSESPLFSPTSIFSSSATIAPSSSAGPAPWTKYSAQRVGSFSTISSPLSPRAGVAAAPSLPGTPILPSRSGSGSWRHELDEGASSAEFHSLLFAKEGEVRRDGFEDRRSLVWWIPELVWLAIAFGCMIVIAIVLGTADGKPPPQWPGGITLNTFVAFCTSLARMAFMIPVVEGLGQLKWTWFLAPSASTRRPSTGQSYSDGSSSSKSERARPLGDFQLFDDATRGAFGSLKLLVQGKGVVGCLGAFITITGLLTSTITQQAVEYPVVVAASVGGGVSNETAASVPVATTINLWDGDTLACGPYDVTRLKHVILDGAFTVVNETVPHAAPRCSSADCDWPVYGSLGICAEVVNLTSSASSVGNATLMDGLRNATRERLRLLSVFAGSVGNTPVAGVYPVVMGPLSGPTGLLRTIPTELIGGDTYVAYSDRPVAVGGDTDLAGFVFLEVAFGYCAKAFRTEVRAGVHTTTELEPAHAKVLRPSAWSLNFPWSPGFYPCYVAGTCNETIGGQHAVIEAAPGTVPVPDGQGGGGPAGYYIDTWTALLSSALLSATAEDATLLDQRKGLVLTSGGGVGQAFATALFGDLLRPGYPTPREQADAVANITANMARAMTNLLRTGDTGRSVPRGGGVSRSNNGDSTTGVAATDWAVQATHSVLGTTLVPQTFVAVRWAWVVLLAGQLALSSVFLLAVVSQSRAARVQVLKSSALASLVALDGGARSYLGAGGVYDFGAVEERAKGLKVRLVRGGSGVVLWLARWVGRGGDGGGRYTERGVSWQPVPRTGTFKSRSDGACAFT